MLAYGRGSWAVFQKPKLIRFFAPFRPKNSLPRRRSKGFVTWRLPAWEASLKTGIDFAYFDLESGVVFQKTTGVYERIYGFISTWWGSSLWLWRLQLRQHTQSSKLLVHFGQFGINRRVDWIGSLVLLALGFQMNLTTSSHFSPVNSPG